MHPISVSLDVVKYRPKLIWTGRGLIKGGSHDRNSRQKPWEECCLPAVLHGLLGFHFSNLGLSGQE